MKSLNVITPVKDSIDSTLDTIKSIMNSEIKVPYSYTIYNDFSTEENTRILINASKEYGFRLINLSDLTEHPSPNYLMVLQMAQKESIENQSGLLIVESDVTVNKNTLQDLFDGALKRKDCGMAASITTDESGIINFPYLYAKGRKSQVYDEKKRFSFCCTLLTLDFLKSFDFQLLDANKNWFDVTISHESIKKGFHNYLFVNLPVLHRPHGSRPWKQLKYTNPLKYYWTKFVKGLDKI